MNMKNDVDNTQQTLNNLCREALDISELDNTEDLFVYGLDSISIINIVAKINKEFNIEMSVNDIIENCTINQIANFILTSGNMSKQVNVHYDLIEPDNVNIHNKFPLTPIQSAYIMGRNTEFEMGGNGTHFYLELKTKYSPSNISKNLNEIIALIPALRTVFSDNYQQILERVPIYEIKTEEVVSNQVANRIKELRNEMSHQVFDPKTWPLFDFRILKIRKNEYYLFVSIDLLIADAASIIKWGNLLADMCSGGKYNLKELDISTRDYILACQRMKHTELYENDYNYWMNKIADFPESPNLPYCKNTRDIIKPHYSRFEYRMAPERWNILKSKFQKKKITPSAALCTIYAELMAKWSDQEKVAINLTAFNRFPVHPEVEELFGDFTTVIPLDYCSNKENDFWKAASVTQSKIYNALEHRHYDGVEFTQELAKYRKYEFGKAVMPIVFSSMLFENGNFGWSELGDIQYAISQTPQVFIDYQVMEDKGALCITWDYVNELFDKNIIKKMFEQYVVAVNNLLDEKCS